MRPTNKGRDSLTPAARPADTKNLLSGICRRTIEEDNNDLEAIDSLIQKSTTEDDTKVDTSYAKSRISGMKFIVLVILCLQNTIFTVLRRYSVGILHEDYSKYEVLLVGEILKIAYCSIVIANTVENEKSFDERMKRIISGSVKMSFLALIYAMMNILSFVALQSISAGTFTVCAQLKILTTAGFSSLILGRKYSCTQWRALLQLILGVLLFSYKLFEKTEGTEADLTDATMYEKSNALTGVMAVLVEVTLSGFASIYFEKMIKVDSEQFTIWERNFQLSFWSFPVYIGFIYYNGGDIGHGWSKVTVMLSLLGAAGGLLVALSIKYGDSVLKTLATTGAIVFSSLLDYYFLGGDLTFITIIAGLVVVLAICNYTFDTSFVNAISHTTQIKK